MSVFNDSDDELVDFLLQKESLEWVEHWKLTRRKAQGGDSALIHFSDFGQFAKILHDIKSMFKFL